MAVKPSRPMLQAVEREVELGEGRAILDLERGQACRRHWVKPPAQGDAMPLSVPLRVTLPPLISKGARLPRSKTASQVRGRGRKAKQAQGCR